MKWFLRLFVALCLFLVGGYALHSQPNDHANYSNRYVTLPAKAHLTSLTATQNPSLDIGNAIAFKAKIRGVLGDTDDDDDTDDEKTSSSQGRALNASFHLPVTSYARSTGCCLSGASKRLPFREHYLYTSSSRYLVFNVFRI